MDWHSLTTEVLARKRQEEEEKESLSDESVKDVFKDFEKVEEALTPLEATALSSILEMASLQLHIIDVGTCMTSPETSNVIARKNVIDVIQQTQDEIVEKGTFEVLYEKTKEEAELARASKSLAKSIKRNQFKIQELKSKLKGHESTKQREINAKQEIIAALKDKTHEEIIKNDVKLRYVEKWEAAKQSQNRIRCQNAEVELEQKLEEVTIKCNNEIRVHDEMCTFLVLEEQTLLKEVEKWKERYETEMKRRTEKIKFLQKRTKEQQILLHELRQLYEEHQQEIENYLDFKEKLRKEQERERHINEMVIKIQAWWRGTMVRRGLGPYKKKKKVGKEKKKK